MEKSSPQQKELLFHDVAHGPSPFPIGYIVGVSQSIRAVYASHCIATASTGRGRNETASAPRRGDICASLTACPVMLRLAIALTYSRPFPLAIVGQSDHAASTLPFFVASSPRDGRWPTGRARSAIWRLAIPAAARELQSPGTGPFFGQKSHFLGKGLAENMDLSPLRQVQFSCGGGTTSVDGHRVYNGFGVLESHTGEVDCL